MHEPHSALAGHLSPGDYGAPDNLNPALTLCERPLGSLLQIAGWEDFDQSCQSALAVFGFDKIGNYRTVQTNDTAQCYTIAPDKILIRHRDANAFDKLGATIDPARLAAIDLSHSRCILSVAGPTSEALMSRLAAIDFSLANFPVGNFVQTGIHHVGVLIARDGPNSFEIFIPVTWAASLWQFIGSCAISFGYRVEGGQK